VTVRLTFPRSRRLTHARQFEAVYAAKMQRAAGPFAIHALPNRLAYCRLGLSVGRRVGTAVQRNRAKRLVREAFRLAQHSLPGPDDKGLDLVVVVRPARPGSELDLETSRELLVELVTKLAAEWQRRGESRER
jgi:ribonuclease P protein component